MCSDSSVARGLGFLQYVKIIALIIDPEHSNGLIKYSIQLAERLGSYLHLLYVENPDPFPLGTKNLSG